MKIYSTSACTAGAATLTTGRSTMASLLVLLIQRAFPVLFGGGGGGGGGGGALRKPCSHLHPCP